MVGTLMAKPPGIPFKLIENLYDEEDAVIAAFIRVTIRMIGRTVIEKPLEANIKQMACLDSKVWERVNPRLKTLLESFYEPFLEHWKRHQCKSGMYDKKAMLMRKANALRKALVQKHVTNVTESVVKQSLKDEMHELSSLPHKLERTTRHDASAPAYIIKQPTKKPPPLKTNMKDV